MPVTSTTKPTIGRVVHVYAARQWSGPRAGVVSQTWPDSSCANVNVMLDGCNDVKLLEFFRFRAEGNTLPSIPVFDPLTEEERKAITIDYWAEWMPFQVSQQQAEIPKRLAALEGSFEGVGEWSHKIEARLAEAESKLATLLTQFESFLSQKTISFDQPAPRHDAPPIQIGLSAVTKSNHEKWLAGGDRSYSKYNRPYDQLTITERREVSLTVRNTIEAVAEATGRRIEIVDDFDQPSPT